MRFGLDFPPFNELSDPRLLADIGAAAEQAGWDGVFLWDHIMYRSPADAAGDPWIGLAAIATATNDVVIGPMVTPLARRRPQVVARQCVGLDQLSSGRFVLGAGLGLDRSGRELSAFGEEMDDRRRARMLDESLDLITALWSGEPVTHRGEYFLADDVRFQPQPIQQPRIPIWLAGRWPYKNPIRRASRYDGLFLIDIEDPNQLREAQGHVMAERGTLEGFDFVVQGTPQEDSTPWSQAGATWWMTKTEYDTTAAAVLETARNGPPQ